MNLIETLTQLLIMVGGGLGIAAIIIAIVYRPRCDRADRGWKCKGDYCDGCYEKLPNGLREYKNQASYKRDLEA